jgi:hypothetical protein
MSDREIYRIVVPKQEQSLLDDTPLEYRVVVPDAPCCCIIHGRYGKRWHSNVSARWLVRHLIEENAKLREERDKAKMEANLP